LHSCWRAFSTIIRHDYQVSINDILLLSLTSMQVF
jgi:hypothetical protein